MIVVLLGPPGAGKGTQGERIAAALGVPKVSTGDVIRAAIAARTPLGLEAKAAYDRGDLVPDDVIMGIIRETIAAPEQARGVVLDGVVRTVPQAEGLAGVLAAARTHARRGDAVRDPGRAARVAPRCAHGVRRVPVDVHAAGRRARCTPNARSRPRAR